MITPAHVLDAPQILSKFIQDNEDGVSAEQLFDGVCARGATLFIGSADNFVASLSSKLIGDFAPGGVRTDTFAHGAAICRIRIFTVKGGNPNRLGWHEGWIEKFSDV